MTCLASCAVSTTGRRADRSACSDGTRFPIIGVTLRLKPLTLHGPRRIFLQELLTRTKRNIKLPGQSNMSINGWPLRLNLLAFAFVELETSKGSFMKSFVLSLVAAAAFLSTTGCATSPRAAVPWEYRVIQGATDDPNLELRLNKAGSEGFAIVSSTLIRGDASTKHQCLVILKRPKP